MEALAELNRIVARHGRAMDTVGTATEQAPTRRGQVNDEPAAASAVAAPDPPSRPATAAAEPSAPQQRGRAEAPPVAPAGQDARGGGKDGAGHWLSNLLTRASREGDESSRDDDRGAVKSSPQAAAAKEQRALRPDDRNIRHRIESLDSLSVDIARMIDHEAAADLWERYNQGERNVFTRRLYTMQGRKAFDEVRKRYKSDREFRQIVDRYIGEFERLLSEVRRDNGDQMVARTYLTSDTGKVYTMLAHAAGRFE
jgi:hypothetical protein